MMFEEYEKLLNLKQQIEFELEHYCLSEKEIEIKKKNLEQITAMIKEIERVR
ncbi:MULTISPECIES: hypothetical protein [unclassified Breznakia]|uniref:hypothetical protein n=1 Tax=unclassified Breznakia TaxID=2623764 RepID=UPI0024742769|nr:MULTISPECIES: hypothetical protein [unclassified Breznakia]MDH6367148.1 hypothetical protein [Breznakia sp. PH1-1]MDH6404265.1 hypothetical protein [Breznakia sp. PF1-11]MDH6412036.1 hypothetical protein [Breznakia sp. PFB1-11]MDH6414253.1 hypothetical protein [Breznakia sp. PFB1-14]MDH6416650.1 hypothetical protein [Breznakia sp. PFB1-4]